MINLLACLLTAFALPGPIGVDSDKYQVPKQTIVGAEKPIPLGELVDLSLSPIDPKPANLVQYAVSWQVFLTTATSTTATASTRTGLDAPLHAILPMRANEMIPAR